MGGHGGLNILPQKRWNVYGQRNRLKVHEDEAKQAEQKQAEQEKRDRAEREFRTDVLRKRVHPDGTEKIEHINLFEEEEHRQEHADVKKERELEDRRRGRKSDRTSDAKFDERFAFVHGLNGTKPWYARPVQRFVEDAPQDSHEMIEDKAKVVDQPENHKKTKTKSKHEKKSKKDKKRKKARALLKELKKSNFKKSEIDVAVLRIERLRREKKEKEKARKLAIRTV